MIELPAQPVTYYKVISWHFLDVSCTIASGIWTYYVNTPWHEIYPDWPGGEPLVDCWLGFGWNQGRIRGWESIKEMFERSSDVDPCYQAFETKEQAIAVGKGVIAQRVLSHYRQLKEYQRKLEEIAGVP